MPKIGFRNAVLLFGDLVLLYVSLALTLFFRYELPFFPASPIGNIWELHKGPFFWIFLIWIVVLYSAGMYDWKHFTPQYIHSLRAIIRPMLVGTALAMLFFYFIPAFKIAPKTNLFINAAVALLLLSSWRSIFVQIISWATKINVLFFGSTDETLSFSRNLSSSPSWGYRVVDTIDHVRLDHVHIRKILETSRIDIVVIEPSVLANQELVKTFYEILPWGVSIISFPEFYASLTGKIPVSVINETWFLENLIEINKRTFEVAKRVLDILISTILLLPFILFLPIIAFFIILSSFSDLKDFQKKRAREGDGMVFFQQKRVGKNGKIFNFIKFRSQMLGAEHISDLKNAHNDPRQYYFGKILRKTYMDELPQIINVLRGEMSLVGPRPERPEYVEKLKKQIPFYEIRLLTKPGITGWAQINMTNDASVEDAPEKLQYDLFYIKNRSLLTDLAIIVKTGTILARRTGR